MAAGDRPEESPDSMKRRCRVTPGRGNPRESATENRRPASAPVTVKRCGKSAPRRWQQRWHGKPHREQCRIGTARGLRAPGPLQPQQVRVGSSSAPATVRPDEWPSRGIHPWTESGLQAARAPAGRGPRWGLPVETATPATACPSVAGGGGGAARPAALPAGRVPAGGHSGPGPGCRAPFRRRSPAVRRPPFRPFRDRFRPALCDRHGTDFTRGRGVRRRSARHALPGALLPGALHGRDGAAVKQRQKGRACGEAAGCGFGAFLRAPLRRPGPARLRPPLRCGVRFPRARARPRCARPGRRTPSAP